MFEGSPVHPASEVTRAGFLLSKLRRAARLRLIHQFASRWQEVPSEELPLVWPTERALQTLPFELETFPGSYFRSRQSPVVPRILESSADCRDFDVHTTVIGSLRNFR
jgi:hypothetical protein